MYILCVHTIEALIHATFGILGGYFYLHLHVCVCVCVCVCVSSRDFNGVTIYWI